MPYSAIQIANEFIRKGVRDTFYMEAQKLQKLVYIAHGWHLETYQRPLITEPVEAWKYGPIVPKLYRAFKKYRMDLITETAQNAELPLDEKAAKLLEDVWFAYGRWSGLSLSSYTNSGPSAWGIVRETEGEWFFAPKIGDSLILFEFEQRRALLER